jgi:predicted anti-sigma-YlaC factor YlaD
MTCQELIEFLDDYCENRVTSQERSRFDLHLSLCQDCRSYVDSYRKTVRLGKAALTALDSAEPIPPALVAAIVAARPRSDSK